MINSIYIIHINEFFTFKLISLNWKNRLYPQSIFFFFEKLAGSKPIICLILQDTFRAHSKIRIYCLSKHKYLKKLTFFHFLQEHFHPVHVILFITDKKRHVWFFIFNQNLSGRSTLPLLLGPAEKEQTAQPKGRSSNIQVNWNVICLF